MDFCCSCYFLWRRGNLLLNFLTFLCYVYSLRECLRDQELSRRGLSGRHPLVSTTTVVTCDPVIFRDTTIQPVMPDSKVILAVWKVVVILVHDIDFVSCQGLYMNARVWPTSYMVWWWPHLYGPLPLIPKSKTIKDQVCIYLLVND